jgi:hypothetical protein
MGAGAAEPSYVPAATAPGFCALLAGSRHLAGIPSAVGTLTTQPGNAAAQRDLSAAIGDLGAVLDDVRNGRARPDLETAVEQLVEALAAARDGALTRAVQDAISTGLDDVGRLVQPFCDLPV